MKPKEAVCARCEREVLVAGVHVQMVGWWAQWACSDLDRCVVGVWR